MQNRRSFFTTGDKLAESKTAQAKAIFERLQRGTIDRSLFTSNANFYFSDQALKDFQSSCAGRLSPAVAINCAKPSNQLTKASEHLQ